MVNDFSEGGGQIKGLARDEQVQSPALFVRRIVKLMRDLGFYPKNHPVIIRAIQDLFDALPALFEAQSERVFIFFDDQLYIDDVLTSSELPETAQFFCDARVEALSLRKGLAFDELQGFLDYLASEQGGELEASPWQSLHIGIGKLVFDEQGNKQIIPFFQDLGFETDGEGRFADEIKMLQDLYVDGLDFEKLLVENVQRIMQKLETVFYSNIEGFIPLCESKSVELYSYVHAINVSLLTMAFAEWLGYERQVIHDLGVGAMLHNVGETQIAMDCFEKKWKLSEADFIEIKTHPLRGANILLSYPEIPRIAPIIAYEHHLKFSGLGYPIVKAGHRQHIASRMCAIADQFDAMRSKRPYHEARSTEEVLVLMQSEKWTGLDPELVDHFQNMIQCRKVA